jgi:multidrug resistance efflux pump
MIDHQLIDQTKTQIRSLVQEISELAKSNCSREEFFEGFLTRVASALASVGGAIWIRDSANEPLQLHYQINLIKAGLTADPQAQVQHGLLLNKLADGGEPTLVAPNSGTRENNEAGNPTEFLLVVGPLVIDQQTVGLVEIFQRPGAGPTTQRGYLRFLMQMCEIASEFLCNQRLRLFAEQQLMWQQLEHFIRTVHQSLDTDTTVYTIANESRRLIDCDRVSVALARGNRCRIKSVSGLDSIERRAEQVKLLGSLSTKVIRAGQPLWYNGNDADLPPQIESRLHEYVDKSHSKMLAIIPLKHVNVAANDSASANSTRGKPIGALIVEQLKDSQISPTLEKRVEVVVEHSELALTNAVEHNSIFLMPLWKTLGRFTSLFRGEKLFKTGLVVATVAVLAAFLCWFPYPFSLGAKGSLTPEIQHEVFAQVAGVLQEIHIENGSDMIVESGQKLATMTNNDLRVEIENLEGELNQTRKQMETLQFSGATDMEQLDGIILSGEFEKAREKAISLERRLQIKLAQASLLEIRAPARGRVVNWQVRQNLLHRPVSRGQNLMTIIDPDTQWQVELEMPERRVSHLLEAMRASEQPLKVKFTLVSHPGQELTGQLLNVDQKLDVHSDEGNSALVRVAFDNTQVDPELLRSGTRVSAKVECGQRPVGYVIFHELIETVQSSLLFWF